MRVEIALLFGLLQSFGIGSFILVGIWMKKYRGGFAWDGSAKQFNYHPVFMVLSMVFLSSLAMVIYRVFCEINIPKVVVKWIHMFIQVIALILAAVGIKAAFDFHNHHNIPNMYTLHSWLGITVVVMFSLQLVCGFFGFFFPKLPDRPRASYLKIHAFFGAAVFLLAIATCLTGMTEKAFFSIPNYKDLPPEGVLVNTLTVVLVVHGGLVFFILKAFRKPKAEEL